MDKTIFCSQCGQELPVDSRFCHICGHSLEKEATGEQPLDLEIKKNKKSKIGVILCSIVAFLVVAAFVVCSIWVYPNSRIEKQDIDSINGSPEFYDLKFGMSAAEVSARIELKNTYRNAISEDFPFPIPDDSKNASVIIEEGEIFYLYGQEAKDVFVGFEKDELESVVILFNKENVKYEEIVKLYTKIYGSPTKITAKSSWHSWIGKKTEVAVFDYDLIEDDGSIVVRYKRTLSID